MTSENNDISHASASSPKPHRSTGKPCGRPRKYPEGVKKHLKALNAEKRAQQATQASTVGPVSQSLTPSTPQNVVKPPAQTVRPLPNYLQAVSPYPTSEIVESEIVSGGFSLVDLGASCAHATGFLSALLEYLTHNVAFEVCGFRWGVVANWEQLSPGFRDLYAICLRKLDDLRVKVLKDAAFQRATVGSARGIYWNGAKVATEHYPSDKMTDLLLRGLDPATFGKVDGQGQQQAVQVNITL